jgi:pimeloyl-ACP methyl ester carboxylesterase
MMRERSIAFGPGGRLIATLCLPADGTKRSDVGQLLFNAGIVHRVGPHRLNVRLARRLAARGVPSIRFDVSGLGDSARPETSASFDDQAVIDLRLAMDALGEAAGVRRFSIFGFCSGGRHAFSAAQEDERVAGAILYDAYSVPTSRARLNYYVNRLRRGGLRAMASSIAARAGRLLGRLRAGGAPQAAQPGSLAGDARIASRSDFAARLVRLRDRGVRVHVIYTGDGGNYNYAAQFHDFFAGTGAGEFVTSEFLPDMNHNATDAGRQEALIRHIEDWTARLGEPRAG